MKVQTPEVWAPIPGYEGRYEVSSNGRIKSLLTGIMLRPGRSSSKYLSVVLSDDSSKGCAKSVHRLVAETFLENPLLLSSVDHIDGDKFNNSLSNLRFCTASQNIGNSNLRSDNTSGYKGVTFRAKAGKWVAAIRQNYRLIYLGSFSSPHDAACAYNSAAKEFFGEFARLNEVAA